MNKKKFINDILLNIITSAVPIGVLQLFVYPLSAKKLGGEVYGLMLTIHSIWIIISLSLGNILNNTRLLLNETYKVQKIEGDFLYVYKILHMVSAAAVCVITCVYYKEVSILHTSLSILTSYFILAKAYLEVEFRIKLNYRNIAANNFYLAFGYVIGSVVFCHSGIWEFVFLFGYGASYLFCRSNTALLKEDRKKTNLYPKVRTHICSLGFASIISNSVIYADKMLLYPLMGGNTVSIYFTATILGKIVSMLTGPITSVMLSYISKWDGSKMKVASKIMLAGGAVSFTGYFAALFAGKPVIGLLYPQWIDEVITILPITTATIMLSVLIGIINPFVLKFCNIRWQMGITAAQAVAYFSAALVLWHFYGLVGFCYGTVIGKVVHLGMLLFVYFLKMFKEKSLADAEILYDEAD